MIARDRKKAVALPLEKSFHGWDREGLLLLCILPAPLLELSDVIKI
jgi:hypothetical protein